MRSYTTLLNTYTTLSLNATTTNSSLGQTLLNDGIKKVYSIMNWPFLENSATGTTVANQQFYNLAYDYGTMINVTMTNGTTVYDPVEVSSRSAWDFINSNTQVTSNIPQYYFIFGNGPATIGFYPTPSASAQTFNYYYKRIQKDLTLADYTSGTITSIANAASAVTGSSTSWTSKMIGRYISITDSNSANTGDGYWYPISAVGSGTTLTLGTPYGGPTISAGSAAYTIGQMSYLPDGYQNLPLYYALWQYWLSKTDGESQTKAADYKTMFYDGIGEMKTKHGSKSIDPTISADEISNLNPNLFVTK